MQKPDYPKKQWWENFVWIFKAEWEEFVRTAVITTAIAVVTFATGQASLSGPAPVSSPAPTGPSWLWITLSVCAVAYLITSCSSIVKIAKRRKFDPTLALRYTDIFFKDNAEEKRIATEALITFHTGAVKWEDFDQRSKVDPVLDTLDDVGFLLQGDQISDWVVYQYFSYWVQLYYEAAEDYIKLCRVKDDSRWEHLPALYDDMMKIAAWKNKTTEAKLVFSDDELVQSLRDEISMMPEKP